MKIKKMGELWVVVCELSEIIQSTVFGGYEVTKRWKKRKGDDV